MGQEGEEFGFARGEFLDGIARVRRMIAQPVPGSIKVLIHLGTERAAACRQAPGGLGNLVEGGVFGPVSADSQGQSAANISGAHGFIEDQ